MEFKNMKGNENEENMKENLKCKNMKRILSNNKPTRQKKNL